MKKLKDLHIPYRLIISVIAGIATASALTIVTHFVLHLVGVLPHPLEPMFETDNVVADLIYHSVFAVAGAYVTAWLAKEQARKAVFILGSKEAIMWGIGILLLWKHAPAWVNITKSVLGPPLAWFGGKLFQIYKLKHDPKNAPAM